MTHTQLQHHAHQPPPTELHPCACYPFPLPPEPLFEPPDRSNPDSNPLLLTPRSLLNTHRLLPPDPPSVPIST